MIEFYDIGVLQSKKYPFLGVSPDAIVKIKIGGNLFYASFEIKTRCVVITIQNAVSAAQAHGKKVECVFGDDVFNECVLGKNRDQLLHQAFITGLTAGVYVVAKVEDGVGEIVQVVLFQIPEEKITEREKVIVKISKPLLSWMYKEEVINRKHLIMRDLPNWVKQKEKETIMSRSKL